MKLSNKEVTILNFICESDSELCGYDIVKAFDGAICLGTIYVLLARLAKKKCLEKRIEEIAKTNSAIPRRFYRLTPFGINVLNAHLEFIAAMNKLDKI